ncbi:MAG: hypothetical protein HC820_00160 [Hydrococcus sp. RM1_1_31]|nr:hypothetical protein [Hydrococcus sp. RM1_1_31]
MQQKERFLELQKEVLAQLYRQWIRDNERVKITFGNLELWRKQATAIGRSTKHLTKIERLIVEAKEELKQTGASLPTVHIPLFDYKVLLRDQSDFNELAFRLIEEHRQQSNDSSVNGNGSSTGGFLNFWNGNGTK